MEEAEMLAETHSAHGARLNGFDQHMLQRRSPPTGLDSIAVIARRNRGEEIHRSDAADDHWYRVLAGVAKCYVVLPGGRRQILDLLLPNDFFGFTPRCGHYFSLEAVVNDTVVACYPRRRAEALADSDPSIGHEVREMMSDAVSRSQELLLILGRTTAREKVGSFLLKMMERCSKQPADRVLLPTSRYDIADYLALSVETVSRSLTELKHRGLIALAGPRRVQIVDRHGLEDDDFPRETAVGNPVDPVKLQ
jgi:CRP/FNR family nitrogen fixation transcriptional regulator